MISSYLKDKIIWKHKYNTEKNKNEVLEQTIKAELYKTFMENKVMLDEVARLKKELKHCRNKIKYFQSMIIVKKVKNETKRKKSI